MTGKDKGDLYLDRLDLLITFFEQEKAYVEELYEKPDKTAAEKKILKKWIEWFDPIIGILKEAKTEEGIKRLKESIEREKQRMTEKILTVGLAK